MVASHIYDLRAAGALGIRTAYVRRTTEDVKERQMEEIKTKAEGGEVDWVVNGFDELAEMFIADARSANN